MKLGVCGSVRSFEQSLVRNGFKVRCKRSRLFGMVPQPFDGRSGKDMVPTDHMQKSRVRELHLVAYGGHTVSAVSGSTVSNRAFGGHFPLAGNSTR